MIKQEKTKAAKKRGTLSWIMEFAGSKRSSYVFSVILAILSVVSGFIPYVFMANIVRVAGKNGRLQLLRDAVLMDGSILYTGSPVSRGVYHDVP